MSFEQHVAGLLAKMASDPRFGTQSGLESALRLLAKWRSRLIDNTIVSRHGTIIQNGPFEGMTFVPETSEANVSPKLLGSYESELHGVIEEICGSNFDCIVDIGCADGYYAVGFAYLMRELQVFAFDINPEARRRCAELAKSNGVSERVSVRGEFRGEDFSHYADRSTLVFLDAEGAEQSLLQPDQFSGLKKLTILVECHDVLVPNLTNQIAERFLPTHHVRRIEPKLYVPELPNWFSQLSHLDQLLAAWEWRSGPTPWLYMRPF